MSASISGQLGTAFAQIGKIFGGPCAQYRPTTATNPLATSIGTVTAAFDVVATLTFRAPAKFGNPIYYAAVNPTLVQVGDYLVGALGTLFVAGLEPDKPPMCVRCNRVVSFVHPSVVNPSTPARNFWFATKIWRRGGGAISTADDKASPASVLQGTQR